MKRRTALRLASTLALALALGGCASVPNQAAGTAGQKADPWESWNRKVFAFNDSIDNAILKPVAEGYKAVVPSLVRTGVTNVFGNINDVWSTANQFLQGKVQDGFEMGMRVLVNSFFGLGGMLDPATEMHLTKRSEDFGQTLGRWGVGPGPYMVLPLFGPSTLRDTAALPLDRHFSPGTYPQDQAVRYSVSALELVNTRTNLLATTGLLDQVALDRYTFVRDAYLSRRVDQIYDGAPPQENFDDEPADPPANK
jgi:phospholipid-binding lipoprotein MlaA